MDVLKGIVGAILSLLLTCIICAPFKSLSGRACVLVWFVCAVLVGLLFAKIWK